MEIKVATGDINKIETDAIVLFVSDGTEHLEGEIDVLDKALDGAISRLFNQGEIKKKLNQTAVIYSLEKTPTGKVAITGLGKPGELTLDKVRQATASACRLLRPKNTENIVVVIPHIEIAGITPQATAQAITEGAIIGLYTFRKHKTDEPENGEIKQLTVFSSDKNEGKALKEGCKKGKIIAEATNLARDMVNEPGNYMTPTDMVEVAENIAETHHLEINILEREKMEEMGMGALLGVARESQEPPKFITLRYNGSDSVDTDLALIGKAITFDSGGISLKPAQSMGEMKGDMAGGASVMAVISAIAQLKPKINIVALIPATENLPGGNAMKPGDILTAMNGKTIEIISTDAEGRLTLADALCYAKEYNAKRIVDVATLTGACRVALGDICTAAFTNNQELVDKIIEAGKEAGELIWQMPMFAEYKELNKSSVADIQNTGGRYGGAITAAQFVAEFAGDTPWVHLDIAGTSMTEKERKYLIKGATGEPVRTLVNFVMSLA